MRAHPPQSSSPTWETHSGPRAAEPVWGGGSGDIWEGWGPQLVGRGWSKSGQQTREGQDHGDTGRSVSRAGRRITARRAPGRVDGKGATNPAHSTEPPTPRRPHPRLSPPRTETPNPGPEHCPRSTGPTVCSHPHARGEPEEPPEPEAQAPVPRAPARPPQTPRGQHTVEKHFPSPLLGRQGRELPSEWGPRLESPGRSLPLFPTGTGSPSASYLMRSFRYCQPSFEYSQALEGATDRADITVMMPVGGEGGRPRTFSPRGWASPGGHPSPARLLEAPLPAPSIRHGETEAEEGQSLAWSEVTG